MGKDVGVGCASSCNEFDLLHAFFLFVYFHSCDCINKRAPHGRLVFTKCVLPSVNNKVGRKTSETDPIKSQISSKTSREKKDSTKRHQ